MYSRLNLNNGQVYVSTIGPEADNQRHEMEEDGTDCLLAKETEMDDSSHLPVHAGAAV